MKDDLDLRYLGTAEKARITSYFVAQLKYYQDQKPWQYDLRNSLWNFVKVPLEIPDNTQEDQFTEKNSTEITRQTCAIKGEKGIYYQEIKDIYKVLFIKSFTN
jgi:hypothetical protein